MLSCISACSTDSHRFAMCYGLLFLESYMRPSSLELVSIIACLSLIFPLEKCHLMQRCWRYESCQDSLKPVLKLITPLGSWQSVQKVWIDHTSLRRWTKTLIGMWCAEKVAAIGHSTHSSHRACSGLGSLPPQACVQKDQPNANIAHGAIASLWIWTRLLAIYWFTPKTYY